jgi:predicted helicase
MAAAAVQSKATTGPLRKSKLDAFLSESARKEFAERLLVSHLGRHTKGFHHD